MSMVSIYLVLLYLPPVITTGPRLSLERH